MHLEVDLRSLFDHISRERGYQSRLSKRNVRAVSVSANPPVSFGIEINYTLFLSGVDNFQAD
jgi:hypothetical protein